MSYQLSDTAPDVSLSVSELSVLLCHVKKQNPSIRDISELLHLCLQEGSSKSGGVWYNLHRTYLVFA